MSVPMLADAELPETCRHSIEGDPRMCSQCRAAPARRITRDVVTGEWLADGKPFVRESANGADARMVEYARKGGRAHARSIVDGESGDES